MSDTPRYLITTADERTWKFDRPVIFLGEWCRHYERRHVWRQMDAIVAVPYGLGLAQKDRDAALAQAIEAQYLPVLREELNRFHGVNRSERYWRIVLGHWLRRYIYVVLNRFQALQQCLENYPILGTTVLGSDDYHLATQDLNSFNWTSNDDIWNSVLTARVLEHLTCAKPAVEVISMVGGRGFRISEGQWSHGIGSRLKRTVRRQLETMANLLIREDDAFIINSYLPPMDELKLMASLGQCPTRHRSPRPEPFDADSGLRKELAERVSQHTENGFSRCVAVLLFELLPTCYLEGYAALCNQIAQLQWPARPKFIFTCNNFDTDEIFKCWSAGRTEDNIPYYTGQHGNNYGTFRYDYPAIEEITSDKFLTWGWTDGLPQHIPAFVFTTAGRKPEAYEPAGRLLLIEVSPDHRITTWDGWHEFRTYFDEQQSFVDKLNRACRDALTIRLHGSCRLYCWSEESRWRDFDSGLRIDRGSHPIRELIAKSRLTVHSYDSTGILETLSQNIPTIAFWQDGLSHLRESARPHYQLLVDAGIVHLTPESAATHVNGIWDDVSVWWTSIKVQTARRDFCNRYARFSKSPIADLKETLTNVNPL